MSCDNTNTNQCTIQCNSFAICADSTLTCTTNSCLILCNAVSACKDSQIKGKTATDLRVICTNYDSCNGVDIQCPKTGSCTIECHSETSCNYTSIDDTHPYNCYGYCAPYVPFPTATLNNNNNNNNNNYANDEPINSEPIPTIENPITTHYSISPTQIPSEIYIPTEDAYPTNDYDNLNVEPDMPGNSGSISSYLAVIFISLLCLMCTNIIYSIIKYLLNDWNNTIHLLNQLKDTENKLINWNQQRTEKLIKLFQNDTSTNDQKTIGTEELKQQYEQHEHKHEQEQKHSYDITQTQTTDLSLRGASHNDNVMADESTHNNTNGSTINSKQNTDTNDIGSVEGTKTTHEMTTDSQIIDVT